MNAGSGANRTTLTINGTLQLNGTLTRNGIDALVMGPGSLLDLNGNTVTEAGSNSQLNFNGTSGSHVTIQSTGSAGSFAIVNQLTISTWTYVDVSGLGDSMFGFGQGLSTSFQSYSNVTFTNMAKVELEASANGANSGILLSNVSFTNPSTTSATAYQPQIDFGSTALGNQVRSLTNVKWSRTSPTNLNVGQMYIRGPGITIDSSVNADYLWQLASTDTVVSNTYNGWHNSLVNLATTGAVPQIITNSYFYLNNTGTSHPMSPTAAATLTVTGSVFENQAATQGFVPGIKWWLYAVATATVNIHNNIFLGSGDALDVDGANSTPTITFYNNTLYVNQQGTFESSPSATLMRVDHVGAFLSGATVQFYNNLGVNPCQYPSCVQNYLISLQGSQNNQVTLADYNTDFPIGGSAYSPATKYSTGCASGCDATPLTNTISVGGNTTYGVNYAAHDFSANPNFLDATRTVATWDSSLGGPGTEAHALAQMLAGTAGYTPSALVTWVRAGFAPTNNLFRASGQGGVDIGAIPWQSTTGGIVQ
jgi:hypothetical protein